ncbi:MAG: hypothetical protein IPG64_27080 [Haliea sp.]|nr:hypothetical protein [Haliea sp.]
MSMQPPHLLLTLSDGPRALLADPAIPYNVLATAAAVEASPASAKA